MRDKALNRSEKEDDTHFINAGRRSGNSRPRLTWETSDSTEDPQERGTPENSSEIVSRYVGVVEEDPCVTKSGKHVHPYSEYHPPNLSCCGFLED